MIIYNYVALKNNRDVVKGKIEANNIREARENIRRLGLLPTKVFEDSKQDVQEVGAKSKLVGMSLKDKIDFTSTFQTLTQSGVPVIEALIFMENDADSARIRMVSKEVRKQIIAGATFADTIAKYPDTFGKVFIGLTKAGEDSGEMDKTLERVIELQKKEAATKSKVIGTLIYPAFVIVLAICIVIIMLTFVFPAFKDMFDSFGRELPIFTRICMDSGVYLKKYWWTIPLAAIAATMFVYYSITWEPLRKKWDVIVLKIPIISNLIRFSNFSNFIAVMQVAYDAGIPIVDCLYLANLTLNNSVLKNAITLSTSKVQQGMHLSTALKQSKVLPQMLLFMMATGEQSGKLGELLHQAVMYIDKELDAVIDTMTKMIEPIMLIVIGAIVLFLALSLYLPLFQSYQLG